MKAVVITRFGGPEALEIQDVPAPQPGPDEILVHVRSTALNRADLLQRQGRYAAPPGTAQNIPGLEFAGEVAKLGANASRWQTGDHVMGIIGGGAHAELVKTHQDAVCAVPAKLEWPAAGAVPEVFITAHDALQQAGFKAGENVLIHAVGSGVGLSATQLVRALGGHAFGTSRTPDKIELAKAFGLESGYEVPEPGALAGLSAFARSVTSGSGFDVVLDLKEAHISPPASKQWRCEAGSFSSVELLVVRLTSISIRYWASVYMSSARSCARDRLRRRSQSPLRSHGKLYRCWPRELFNQ